jgi:CheY-like chemotaxis protein
MSVTPEAMPTPDDATRPHLFQAVMAKPWSQEPLLQTILRASLTQPLPHPAPPAPPPRPADQTEPEPLRVMVVDDDPTVRALAAAALQADGCEVSLCADGFAALQALAATPHDVVVLDLLMPDIDGLATARLAYEFLSRADRPRLIALTSAPDQLAAREHGTLSLFDAILPKSSNLSAVAAAVRRSAHYRRRNVSPPMNLDEVTRLTALLPTLPSLAGAIAAAIPRADGQEPQTDILDTAALNQVATHLPRATLAANLRLLAVHAQSLRALIDAPPADCLAHQVHALAGAAGLLGFRRLCEACLRTERACQSAPADLPMALQALGPALDLTRTTLDRLLSHLADA